MQIISEESNHMLFSPDVTLTHRAYVSVAAALFNQKTICCIVKKKLLDAKNGFPLEEIIKPVLSHMEQLNCPNTLKLGLKSLIPVIGRGICCWTFVTKYSCRLAYTYNKLPQNVHLIWTEKGTFDFIKTAKAIIDCNPSNSILCYCLATLFCIEEILSNPDAYENLKHIYDLCRSLPGANFLPYFLKFWEHKLESGTANFDTILSPDRSERGCELALSIGCVPVLKYFFDKLPPERKLPLIQKLFNGSYIYPKDGNILLFLFSNLQVSEMNKIICKYPYKTLECLIVWPHQECFMQVANSYWNYLTKNEYKMLFFNIACQVAEYQPSLVHIKLIQEFWCAAPKEFKEFFIHECVTGSVLRGFLFMKYTNVFRDLLFMRRVHDIVQMILNYCSAEQRQQIIFNPANMDMCEVLTRYQLWDSLKLLVLSCIPSDLVLESFIVQFQNRISHFVIGREFRNAFIEKIRLWYKKSI